MHSTLFTLILTIASTVVNALPAAEALPLTKRDVTTEPVKLDFISGRSIHHGIQNVDNYVSGSPINPNITAGQSGLPFTLDIGVIDVNSCQPITAMVEVWSSNAIGDYGDFLRGATSSDSNGIAEFQTIFPGCSDGDGANHLNIAVHSTSDISSPSIHVGKLYFADRWTDLIWKTSPYSENANSRVLNEDDPDFKDALAKGYSPIISIKDDLVQGIVGIITVCVNSH